jgi:hypothetical protein
MGLRCSGGQQADRRSDCERHGPEPPSSDGGDGDSRRCCARLHCFLDAEREPRLPLPHVPVRSDVHRVAGVPLVSPHHAKPPLRRSSRSAPRGSAPVRRRASSEAPAPRCRPRCCYSRRCWDTPPPVGRTNRRVGSSRNRDACCGRQIHSRDFATKNVVGPISTITVTTT